MVYWMGLYVVMAILNSLSSTGGSPNDRSRVRNSTTKVVANVGSKVWLNCSVVASQDDVTSDVTWFKFGKPLFEVTFRSMDSVFELGRHALLFDEVLLADAGRYLCIKVTSQRIENITFNLSVKEPRELPVITDSHGNISTTLGRTVVFGCKVQSRTITYIEWRFLRSIPVNTTKNTINDSTPLLSTKVVSTKLRLRVLVPLLDDSLHGARRTILGERRQTHEDLLYIYNVTNKDSGTYVCLAFNKYGKALKEAYLTILTERVEPSCAAKLGADSTFPVAILIAIPAGLFVLACTVIVRSLEKSRQERKLLATEKEKEKEVPALKSSATDVNENKPVAMVTAQNFRPVIHERIRAVSIDEQRFNSLSTSSASEIEIVLTDNKLSNHLNLSKQSSLPSSTEAPYTSQTPDLISSSSCGLDLDWEGVDLTIPKGIHLVQLSREAEV